jgi:hypothetical protein
LWAMICWHRTMPCHRLLLHWGAALSCRRSTRADPIAYTNLCKDHLRGRAYTFPSLHLSDVGLEPDVQLGDLATSDELEQLCVLAGPESNLTDVAKEAARRSSPGRARDQVITGKARCERGVRLTATVGVSGIVSYVRPSRRRPAFFLFLPPHCLKKNATPARAH